MSKNNLIIGLTVLIMAAGGIYVFTNNKASVVITSSPKSSTTVEATAESTLESTYLIGTLKIR